MILPGPDVKFTPVDNTAELKENREPALHPYVLLVILVTRKLLGGLYKIGSELLTSC